jgi:hypothetical protein
VQKRFIAFSLLFHGFILLAVGLMARNQMVRQPIEVVVQYKKTSAKHSSKRLATGIGSDKAAAHGKQLDLGLSTLKSVLEKGPISEGQLIDPEWAQSEKFQSDLFSQFEGMEMHEIQFVQSLWGQIDHSIETSPYLSEYGHFGKVYLSFEINELGELVEHSFQVKAEDRVLKVIAARSIRKALNNRFNKVLPEKRIRINTQFAWLDCQACQSLRGIEKNNLSFCHYAEDKRKNFSAGEKTATYLGALKYGFGAIDEIRNYQHEEMRRNTQFDPFESYKRDPDWNLGS